METTNRCKIFFCLVVFSWAFLVAETEGSSNKCNYTQCNHTTIPVQPYDASLFDFSAMGGQKVFPRSNCRLLNTADSLSLDHLMNSNPNIRCTANRILDAQGKFVLPLMRTIRQQMLSRSTVSQLQELIGTGDAFPNRTLHEIDTERDHTHCPLWYTYAVRQANSPALFAEVAAGFQKAFGASEVVFAEFINMYYVPQFQPQRTRYHVHTDLPLHQMCMKQFFGDRGLTPDDFEETSFVTNVIGIHVPKHENQAILGLELFDEVEGDHKPADQWEADLRGKMDSKAPFMYAYDYGETLWFNALRYHRGYITPREAFSSESVERTEIVIFGARKKFSNTWYVMPMCKKTTSEEYQDVMPEKENDNRQTNTKEEL